MPNEYQPGADGLMVKMRNVGIAVTRENYIVAAYGVHPLPIWTAELEAELPEELQDWGLFEVVGDELVLK